MLQQWLHLWTVVSTERRQELGGDRDKHVTRVTTDNGQARLTHLICVEFRFNLKLAFHLDLHRPCTTLLCVFPSKTQTTIIAAGAM